MSARQLAALHLPAANRVGWVFILVFVATYVVLYLGYSTIPDAVLQDDVYYHTVVGPAETMINWVAPGEHAVGARNLLYSATVKLNIVRGCDGAGVIFLLTAAIVAYRARIRAAVLGIAGAVALVYMLNQIRIITLFFVDAHRPSWFMPMHVYFIPTLMILIGMIYFAVWAAHGQHEIERATQG